MFAWTRRALWIAPLAAVVLLAVLAGGPAPAVAQTPGGEPAVLTLLNPATSSRTVFVDTLDAGGQIIGTQLYLVAAGDARTLLLDLSAEVGAAPDDLVVRCVDCVTLRFGLAAGQRALVALVAPAGAAGRADLRLLNQSAQTQTGLLRTGATLGAGRPLAPFRLAPGESLDLGLRLADGQTLDFNLDCDRCTPQRARLGNGVDLEIVIR